MGREKRAKEQMLKAKHARRFAWLKGLAGFMLIYILLPFVFAKRCYEENEWPWEGVMED